MKWCDTIKQQNIEINDYSVLKHLIRMNKILILGNGFDLDVGLPTSYNHFINSDEFKKLIRNRNNYLLNYIYNNYSMSNWVDLENELRKFALSNRDTEPRQRIEIKHQYDNLCDALICYLKKAADYPVNKKSLGCKLMEVVAQHIENFEIFSFNYTDLNMILKKLGIVTSRNKELFYTQVHGSLNNSNIVVGFQDNTDCSDDFSYMIKTLHPNYQSHNIRKSLLAAQEIIFFGHSLGDTDYHYFSQLFEAISNFNVKDKTRYPIRLTIITHDEDSKNTILRQLWKMNNAQTNILYDQNELTIYCTNTYSSNVEFYFLLKRIDLECKIKQALFQI